MRIIWIVVIEIVKLLIEAGGDVNQATDDGSTPLYIASQQGHTDIVVILSGTPGIQINQANNDGCTSSLSLFFLSSLC